MQRLLLCCSFLVLSLQAYGQPDALRVATRLVKPFVYEENGVLTGFSIELWQEISKRLKIESHFAIKADVNAILAAVKSGDADLGIAAISVTAERESALDFSQPMFDSGLQIMVPAQSHRSDVIAAVIEGIFSSAMLPLLGTVAILILVPAHLVWFWERRHPAGMLAHQAYFPGIFEAFWWAASTLATQADQMPRTIWARVVAVIWMFASVIFVAYFTASVTSNLTLQQLHGDINGPTDLLNKRVVSLAGSTAVDYLRQHNIPVREFEAFDDAVGAVQTGQADALVYDAPTLLYYAAHDGSGKVQVVGPIFRRENYGIAFRDHSPQLKAVNSALLQLKENGAYDRLYARWFGAK